MGSILYTDFSKDRARAEKWNNGMIETRDIEKKIETKNKDAIEEEWALVEVPTLIKGDEGKVEGKMKLISNPPSPVLQNSKSKEGRSDFIQWENPSLSQKIGTLLIPRIGLKVPVILGTAEEDLERGIGVHSSLSLPGDRGNAVLAGHNNTSLKRAGEIKVGDDIIIEVTQGKIVYRVKKTWVTDMNDSDVLSQTNRATMHLYTCYPLDQLGYTTKRYVIKSEFIEVRGYEDEDK
ncbi:class D sortase [Mechercharimyces sp. CAU 1602]|uniref:class D sortase n=1 Tax=Mechercharimyces sp. CAU 1602 TaxID=2973933 RepID=UPI002161F550|nr:class D sortase [Mechercharimyces sp. CAU 1602]